MGPTYFELWMMETELWKQRIVLDKVVSNWS